MKIKDLAKVDMPREKLEKYGEAKLQDHELLAILLGSGIKGTNVIELSKKILATIRKTGQETITLTDLRAIKGLGAAKAAQVMAVIALTKRFTKEVPEILSAADIWNLCADIRGSKKEHFIAFYIDTQNRLIERQIISVGTLNASLVHPRELFEPAIRLHAASVIVAHNHPSGILTPSSEDREVTRRLQQAGQIVGIQIVDHVIVSESAFYRFEQKSLL